jgi:hypothetical protein
MSVVKMKRLIILAFVLAFTGGSTSVSGDEQSPCEILGKWPVSVLCEDFLALSQYGWMHKDGVYESYADCVSSVNPIFSQCCNTGGGSSAACWCKWLGPENFDLSFKNVGQCVKALTHDPIDGCGDWNPHCK